jgi:hypothetical protein
MALVNHIGALMVGVRRSNSIAFPAQAGIRLLGVISIPGKSISVIAHNRGAQGKRYYLTVEGLYGYLEQAPSLETLCGLLEDLHGTSGWGPSRWDYKSLASWIRRLWLS